ncbi:MAG: iron-sulfur cluster assembly accessory protein [Candidatus Methanogaster sp.]|uniref:Iron-sulfur cluster assembly accessory protein n=1 Tax=Candidatus Methanogaster sp. TaxID=3386292 RepID=A0AC61L7L2_9EURY|nr:MAG: iron-sulfur cluster assembly accessory protein [ANME-2 cluster archaeon]
MVTISRSAADELKSIFKAEASLEHADCGLRIYVAGMGDHGIMYGLELDNARHDRDIVLDLGGIKTLIDEKIAPSVQNIVIDFTDTHDGRGFVISDPYLCCGRR